MEILELKIAISEIKIYWVNPIAEWQLQKESNSEIEDRLIEII